MAEPIRKTVSIIDKNFSPGSGDGRMLSLELLPDSMMYAILDASASNLHLLEVFEFDKPSQWIHKGSAWLQSAFDAIPALNERYQQVRLVLNYPQLVLLPAHLDTEKVQQNAHRLSCGILSDSIIKTDTLTHLQGFGVYAIQQDVGQLFDSMWPGNISCHAGSVFIESVLAFTRKHACPDIVLHVRSSTFDVLLFEHALLSFYQVFHYEQVDDLLFYLFYVLDVFNKKPSSLNMMLAGEIDMDSDLCCRLNAYFKETHFFDKRDSFTHTPSVGAIPGHFYTNLLQI